MARKHVWTTEEIIDTYGEDYDGNNEELMSIEWVRLDRVLKVSDDLMKEYHEHDGTLNWIPYYGFRRKIIGQRIKRPVEICKFCNCMTTTVRKPGLSASENKHYRYECGKCGARKDPEFIRRLK